MTGEPVDAAEAERIGLVDGVVPLDELMATAEKFAARLTRHADYAVRTAKQLLNRTLDVDLAEAIELERTMVRGMANREQFAAARTDAARRLPTYARIFGGRSPAGPVTAPAPTTAAPAPAAPGPAGPRADQPPAGIEVTGVRQREAWAAGVLPPVEEVRPGLWSIPVTIPGSRMRYVLAYALALPDGVALVDTGWDAQAAWDDLVAGLAAAGYGIRDVRAVLATHVHTDHFGLAGRIRDESGAWLGLHAADAAMVGVREDDGTRAELAARWDELRRRLGAPAGRSGMTDRKARKYIPQTRPDVLIEDGVEMDLPGWQLRAIWTPGHSPGHICFHEPRVGVLLAGDHVLPRITPNVSVHSRQRDDPLGDYLNSLAAVRDLPVDEVLPAHEYRFRGLRARVDHLLGHHQDKLAAIEKLLIASPGLTCWQVAGRLSWARPFGELTPSLQHAAARETLAHLVLLDRRGRVRHAADMPEEWFIGDHDEP